MPKTASKTSPTTSAPRRATARATPIPPGDDVGAAELAARVAANLREHRRRRDMSLDQMAQRTGVSRAGLSQIETCKTNPSLGVLWKIAAGLGVPFAELIGEGQTGVSVLRRDDSRVLRSTDHKLESRPLMPAAGGNQLEMYELRLSARAQHVSDAHGPGTRELVTVLNGNLRMVVGSQSHELGPGDSMLFDSNQAHTYDNPGPSEARYHDLIIYPQR
jgi:XRE family transcriptional regulator, regulator of sulfur utilization